MIKRLQILLPALILVSVQVHADESGLSPAAAKKLESIRSLRDGVIEKNRAPLRELKDSYHAALVKLGEDGKSAGNLKRVVAVDDSIRELNESGAPDGKSDDAEVAQLEKIYLKNSPKLEARILPSLIRTNQEYHEQLGRIVVDLTKRDQISDALIIKDLRTKVAEEVAQMQKKLKPKERVSRIPGEMPPSSVTIVKALYGSGGKNADVTRQVTERVAAMKDVRGNSLGKDPNPGWHKQLRVTFTKDGKRRKLSRHQSATIPYEAFAGPQDSEELEEWLTGTRWRYRNMEIVFQPNRKIVAKTFSADWEPADHRSIHVTWEREKSVMYKFDFKLTEVVEAGGEKRTFVRAK